jgi:2-aminobenzoate-CoA ligase
MYHSAHTDTFTRDRLPPLDQQPDFLFTLPDLHYPERINAATAFVDCHIDAGSGDAPCLISASETLTYRQLQERVNRIANVLIQDCGLVPGNRVLLRSANTPMVVACIFAVIKAGGVVVATMPMLRAKELAYPVTKAKIALALCDHRLVDELQKTRENTHDLKRIVAWGDHKSNSLETLMAKPGYEHFTAVDTAQDDVCLIGFTSGTTGEPKGTMHFHRDLLAICDTYSAHVLKPTASDRFIGSPPLAFTFGLGGLVLFPLRVGASAVLLEATAPDLFLQAVQQFKPTICFTAPTAYRSMLTKLDQIDISSLKKCVSAGEALPRATFEAWKQTTGLELLDGIGATEMLHIFIASPRGNIRPGSTGIPVPGFEAKVIDADGRSVADGVVGKLAVRGPTGCRYLDDDRQKGYVKDGWNVTGDSYLRDAEGYFWYQARSDDMIVSSGYNIAGPEVEGCLLTHPAIAECGVVGQPDADRGMIVKAYVVLKSGNQASLDLTKQLQDYVKAEIAPYKYPRSIAYVDSLPRTQTGKLQRFELRSMAAVEASTHTARQGQTA